MDLFFVIVLIVGIPLGIRMLAGSQDKDRIGDYLRSQGATLTGCEWSPFAKGWVGSEKERLYAITYIDSEGNTHQAVCKTNMFAGVYFTEDVITSGSSKPNNFPNRGMSEVERLRREVADLKRQLNEQDPRV